jgi:hypothetical protein
LIPVEQRKASTKEKASSVYELKPTDKKCCKIKSGCKYVSPHPKRLAVPELTNHNALHAYACPSTSCPSQQPAGDPQRLLQEGSHVLGRDILQKEKEKLGDTFSFHVLNI